MFKDEKGGTLVLVIIIMAVFAIIGTAFITATTGEGIQAINHQHQMQAHYNARSGAYIGLEWLNKYKKTESGQVWLKQESPEDINLSEDINSGLKLDGKKSDINLFVSKNGDEIEINSTGFVGNQRETLIIQEIKVVSKGNEEKNEVEMPAIDMAIFANGEGDSEEPSIKLEGSSAIIGSAGTNSAKADSVQFGWSTMVKNGDLHLGPGGIVREVIKTDKKTNNSQSLYPDPELKDWTQVEEPWLNVPNGTIKNLSENRIYPEIKFPEYPSGLKDKGIIDIKGNSDGLIVENGYYSDINVSGDNDLKINIGNQDRIIRVKKLNIQQGHIKLTNVGKNGRLLLYVEEEFTLGGSSTINDGGEIGNVMMCYEGSEKPSLGGNTRLVGNSFIKSAEIEIGGSNGITGHIIAGSKIINVTGNADLNTRLLYAPSAKLIVGGSGKIKGVAVVRKASLSGSGSIVFSEPDLSNLPGDIFEFERENAGGGSNIEDILENTIITEGAKWIKSN